jgi:hypothetical protein
MATPKSTVDPSLPLGNSSSAPDLATTKRRIALVALASFLVTMWLPICSASRFADLSNWYNDHLHHAYAVWVFGERGFDVYRMGFAEAARGVHYAHPVIGGWGENPMVYPPGIFAVFAPVAWLGSVLSLSLQQFGAVSLVWLLSLAHVSLYAFWSGLASAPRGTRALLGVVIWLMFLRMALNGFYDVVWLGFAAMMAQSAAKERHGEALLWCGAAAFTHYRAAVLLPLLLWVLLRALRDKPLGAWPWKPLSATLLLGLVALYTFVLMYPHSSVAAASAPPLQQLFVTQLTPWLVLGAVLAASGCAFRTGGWVPASTVAIVGGIALLELPTYRTFWWHACIGLAVPLLANVPQATRSNGASRLRQLGLLLHMVLEALVFNDRQGGTFGVLAQLASDYHAR